MTMTLWALVPVKSLRRGKSRLAEFLTEDERAALNQHLLERTLATLAAIKEVAETLTVSRDPYALEVARGYGAKTLLEDGRPNLNSALAHATEFARLHAPRGVLILPTDLPLLERADVLALIERAINPPVVVIAPDRHGKGTNALLTSPTGIIEYAFGEDSFQRHCARAIQCGARLEVVETFALGLDLDLPEDLKLAHELEGRKAI
jgi:2-phospho-L-lactate guanylyltransferase